MKKLMFNIYLKLIRSWLSPLLYWILRFTKYKDHFNKKWSVMKVLTKSEFSSSLKEFSYLWDYKRGIVDFSVQEPGFFFGNRKYYRDCDDFARMWYWWAKDKGYPVWEVLIVDGFNLRTGHIITIFHDDDGFNLCNYRLEGTYSSFEEAINQFKIRELTSHGKYKDLTYVVNKKANILYGA